MIGTESPPRGRGKPESAATSRPEDSGRRLYRVDATFGTAVRVGQRVGPGDRLGLTSSRQEVLVVESGEVVEVVFEPSSHSFIITIVPTAEEPRTGSAGTESS